MSVSEEVIVIGSGLAGVAAAWHAKQLGKRVRLIAKSKSAASALSSGAWDIASPLHPNKYDDWHQTTSINENIFQMIKENEYHPYAILSQDQEDFYHFINGKIAQFAEALDLKMVGNFDQNRLHLTQFGRPKICAFVQESMSHFDLSQIENARVLVVGVQGYKDFDAHFVKHSLEYLLSLQNKKAIEFLGSVEITIPGLPKLHSLTALDLARFFDQEENFVNFGRELVNYIEGKVYTHLLFPPILGLKKSRQIIEALQKITHLKCAETLASPMSVPGFRLQAALEQFLLNHEIELIHGEVKKFEHLARQVKYLDVLTRNGLKKVACSSVILASGKFIGGGIKKTAEFEESIFNLPLFIRSDRVQENKFARLSGQSPQATQDVFSMGLRVNAQCQVLDEMGEILYDNLYAAGNVLGGYDHTHQGCGAGVAILSGVLAAQQA